MIDAPVTSTGLVIPLDTMWRPLAPGAQWPPRTRHAARTDVLTLDAWIVKCSPLPFPSRRSPVPSMASRVVPTLTAHGAEIPAIGFGTSSLAATRAENVATALKLGYRHIDTARNMAPRGVGEGIRASGVPRGESSSPRRCRTNICAPTISRARSTRASRSLRVDYVDLLLVHWPNPEIPLARDDARAGQGEAARPRAPYRRRQFQYRPARRGDPLCPEPLVTLQAEYHPYSTRPAGRCLPQTRADLHRLLPARPRPHLQGPGARRDRQAHKETIAQIALRWLIQQGIVAPIPRSSNPRRMADNLAVFDFTLTARRDEAHRRAQAPRRPYRQSRPAAAFRRGMCNASHLRCRPRGSGDPSRRLAAWQ